ncbi:hypothetical protein QYE76_002137 [Lolium multiflorum]|jgi:hypothetical protein|uniref:Uncharacterized protein n=1 Tax=Lolium multiflorum TaxID=4521 RepID=A0AAD8RP48_LOLMU|nr:hypothetical protein QYE76_002137 [Lolium multiflorum]
MGRGSKSAFASLFGLRSKRTQEQEEEDAAARRQQQQEERYRRGTRVRPSDDDYYYGRHWYADRDINRKASEFIDRVHRGMLTNDEQDQNE